MEEPKSAGVKPVFNKEDEWKANQQRKQLITKPRAGQKVEEPDAKRRPAPLPFGKLDIFI